ncbi:MAG: SIMPL domain-containing protein [archaeon]|nr:SIMPL domain-containing protein [archaeon]
MTNKLKGGWNMDNRILIALVIGILLVGGYIYYNTGAIVSAQGSSNIKVQPDEVSIYLNIETKNLTAQGAKDANDEITDNVVTELVKLGLERKDIQFSSYNTYPEYDWSNGQQKFKGYVVSQQLVIKTKDFDLVYGIVDKSVNAGALVNYINFELSDEKQSDYKSQALTEAGKDAKDKAEATAAGLGKNLGRLVSVQSQDFYYQPWNLYDKAVATDSGGAREVAMNIQPQDKEVTASITVQYKLSLF